ncbi:MAG: hypothetical protein ABUK13_07945 [Gammaproteobacteria bacterium]
MKIIRRFFVYLFTILTVLILTYGYVYWGDLFGSKTPIGYVLNMPTDENDVSTIETETIDEQSDQLDEKNEPLDVIETAQDMAVENVVIQPDTDVVIPPATEIVLTESQPPANNIILSRDDKAAIETQKPVEPSISIGDLWKKARDSFHYRDYETSIESYKQLIARTQDNFDAFEELGDVYKYYGMKKEAAAAYYEAATILVRLGRIDHAADFMKPLTLTDTVKAKSLLDLIKAEAISR